MCFYAFFKYQAFLSKTCLAGVREFGSLLRIVPSRNPPLPFVRRCFAWSFTKKGSLSYAEARNRGREKRRSSPARFHFSLSPASLQHKKGFGCGGDRERMAYYEKRASIGFSCVLSRLNCRPEAFFVARGGILRARQMGEIAGKQGIGRFL